MSPQLSQAKESDWKGRALELYAVDQRIEIADANFVRSCIYTSIANSTKLVSVKFPILAKNCSIRCSCSTTWYNNVAWYFRDTSNKFVPNFSQLYLRLTVGGSEQSCPKLTQ